MAAVYILYCSALKKYYVGSCKEVSDRVHQHLEKYFPKAFTSKANDWIIFFAIDRLTYEQARDIEMHIKRMKSKKYIDDLKKYPELSVKLIQQYLPKR